MTDLILKTEETSAVADAAEHVLIEHAAAAGTPFVERHLSLTAFGPDAPDEPLGYLQGLSQQGRFYLARLAVLPAARGRGVGSFLMAELEAIARARQCQEIVLDTWCFQAEGFYAALGYRVIGRLDDLPGAPAKVWMVKRL